MYLKLKATPSALSSGCEGITRMILQSAIPRGSDRIRPKCYGLHEHTRVRPHTATNSRLKADGLAALEVEGQMPCIWNHDVLPLQSSGESRQLSGSTAVLYLFLSLRPPCRGCESPDLVHLASMNAKSLRNIESERKIEAQHKVTYRNNPFLAAALYARPIEASNLGPTLFVGAKDLAG